MHHCLISDTLHEGRMAGLAEGKAEVLVLLLRDKFGDVPSHVQAQVAQASSDDLNMWVTRVRTAKSPEAVVA